MKCITLLLLTFTLSSYAAMMTKVEYIQAVEAGRGNYPIDQGNGTELSDSYMKGDTNVIVTTFKNLAKSDIGQADIDEMEVRLIDALTTTYCGFSGLQFQVRKAGVDIEYQFVDKYGERVWTYTASESVCQRINSQSEIRKLQANVDDAKQQINKLVEFGKGRVTLCRLKDNSNSVNIGFANEFDQPYIFLSAVGEYAVNIVHLYLTQSELRSLSQIIDKAVTDAENLNDIETVELAKMSAKGGSVHLVSQFGKISTFFSANESVDSVLTKPDMAQLKFCLNEGQKFL